MGEKAGFALAAGIARPLLNLFMRKEWRGIERLENLPGGGGFIACPNHCTEIDPLTVGHMLYNQGRPPHFLAKAGLFKPPFLRQLMRATKQIPVDRGGTGAGSSLEVARQVLDEGGAIIVYPEGTLTRDPALWPMKGHTGAARLALKTGAPVVPIAHWGDHELFPRYAKRLYPFPRKKAVVLVGDPVDLSDLADHPLDKTTLVAATDRIMDAITALLAELRGEQAPAQRWDPSQHQQTLRGRDVERGGTSA
ncbi:lysophospholipid acyltransferase family protein [Sinomonas notoginsengisoli]|uniref:lysophospholipid acyltransferase family protein n=1 Tax=Sinomonas notoginsengisoli TaxID=1457311 RepID=UPI001F386934|nr:lysophospholipid acyltransferase family protein [Sinomonas notoginsengisoli]